MNIIYINNFLNKERMIKMAVNAMLSKGIQLKLDDTTIEGLQSTPEISESK